MSWYNEVERVRYTDRRALARVMSKMWELAADMGDYALLDYLTINLMDCLGAAYALDGAGIPVPDVILMG